MTSRVLLVAAPLLAFACTSPALETDPASSAIVVCEQIWGCNSNTARSSDGRIFHDLDLGPLGTGGAANSGGFRITGVLRPDGSPMALEVDPADLDALVGRAGHTVLKNDQLVGTRIQLTDEHEDYDLRLDEVDRIEFWVGRGAVTTYRFTIRTAAEDDSARVPLCKAASGELLGWNGQMHHAVVFRGDRVEVRSKDLTVGIDTWINVACAGSAVAKIHLLRHTTAGSSPNFQTTQPERQAMLRALLADYCGAGFAYTEDGHPLAYADHKGWHPDGIDVGDPDQRARVEGVWGPAGALCLDMPRKYALEKIGCRVPRCPVDLSNWQSKGHVLTVNPPPLP
jgi:hypothetical protein